MRTSNDNTKVQAFNLKKIRIESVGTQFQEQYQKSDTKGTLFRTIRICK